MLFCSTSPVFSSISRLALRLFVGLVVTNVSAACGNLFGQTNDALIEQSQSPAPSAEGSSVTPILNQGRLISAHAQASLIINVTIAASMPGEIAHVDVKEGQSIGLGGSLVRLGDELARAELIATQRAFDGAEIQAGNDVDARFASRTLDVRIREYEQSVAANRKFARTVSETELDRLRLVVDQSRLGIEQAEHEQRVAMALAGEKQAIVEAAAVRLRKHAVIAPHAAQVADVFVQVGQRMDAGEPLVRLIDLETLKVECLVDAELARQTAAGDRVVFHFDDDQMCEGHIEFVSLEIHPVTEQVRILATVKNPSQKLRPGTRGRLMAVESSDSGDLGGSF